MAHRQHLTRGIVFLLLCCLIRGDGETKGQEASDGVDLASAPPSPAGAIPIPIRRHRHNLAGQIEKALEKEFPENSHDGDGAGRSYNDTLQNEQAVLETVARVTHEKPRGLSGALGMNGTDPKTSAEVIITSLENTATFIDNVLGGSSSKEREETEVVARLIDASDNEFVISNPKTGALELQQDLLLITDIVVIIVFAATGGFIFASLGQPVITGYLVAGSLCGPGGFGLVHELVQVETLAQFGVVFLLFSLGVEFSMSKLQHVRSVAILGGATQILLLVLVCGLLAKLAGAPVQEGVFIGAFLSMSSTALVLKCLQERSWLQSLQGQVMIGTLILQDCVVGLLFALLPVLGGSSSMSDGFVALTRNVVTLAIFLAVCFVATRTALPTLLRQVALLTTTSEELFHMVILAFCLTVAWLSDYYGLSIELGAFVSGVMISTTDYAERTMHQLEAVRNLFAALFLASIGLIMNPPFLWTHLDILLSSLVLVFLAKTILITIVVRAFGYNARVAFVVGTGLAQIGEFAFVLLSKASNLGVVQRQLYLLLLGTTALSIMFTPLIFRMIPYMLRFGTLMRWFKDDRNDSNNDLATLAEMGGNGEMKGALEKEMNRKDSDTIRSELAHGGHNVSSRPVRIGNHEMND